MSNSDAALWLIPLVAALMLMVLLIGARLNRLQERLAILSRVEAKLDLLLKQANIRFEPYVNLPPEIAEALGNGKKILAIKLQRESSGMGLKEAKDFIEEVERRAGTG
jgi:Ribosomal protein L7/L12 C-terminal domain